MPRISIRAAARDDLIDHYRWLYDRAGVAVADAMLDEADRAFDRLADHPAIGPCVATRAGADIRKWRVDRFDLLIFYRREGEALAVIRVLHPARDWSAILSA